MDSVNLIARLRDKSYIKKSYQRLLDNRGIQLKKYLKLLLFILRRIKQLSLLKSHTLSHISFRSIILYCIFCRVSKKLRTALHNVVLFIFVCFSKNERKIICRSLVGLRIFVQIYILINIINILCILVYIYTLTYLLDNSIIYLIQILGKIL